MGEAWYGIYGVEFAAQPCCGSSALLGKTLNLLCCSDATFFIAQCPYLFCSKHIVNRERTASRRETCLAR